MESTAHLPILKRVGGVLLTVGLLDIAVMIYCVVNSISYSSSFNFFAVVAGIFLLRGSLRAASIVRWFSAFMLTGFSLLLVAWPFMQPLDLTLTEIRLNPGAALGFATLMIAIFVLLAWQVRELGREQVQIALVQLGRKRKDLRIPVALGAGIVVLLGIFLSVLLGGESAIRAKAIAQQQLGSSYSFHVSSLNIAKSSQGTYVSGVVTAWNEREIKNIPVRWEER